MLRLNVDYLINSARSEDMMASPNPFGESESDEQPPEFAELDIRVGSTE